MARHFLKLALDIYRDPKVRRYLPDDGDKWCWVALLCYAKESATPGTIEDDRWELAERLGVDEARLERVVTSFTTCPRPPLAINEDGALVITNWENHQIVYPSDTKEARRNRAHKHRESKKTDVTTGNECNDVTECVTGVTKKTTSDEIRGDKNTSPPTPPAGGTPAVSGKGTKTATTTAPDNLTPEQVERLKRWRDGAFPWLTDGALHSHAQQCLDWNGGRGNRHADWVRTCQTWIRKDIDDGKIKQQSETKAAPADSWTLYVKATKEDIAKREKWITDHPGDPRIPAAEDYIRKLAAKLEVRPT